MPLETGATYIADLVSTNPADTDNESQGAAHLRLVKSCLKTTFPNLGDAAVSATAAQLNSLVSTLQGSGTVLNPQGLNGTVPMGTVHMFARDPGTTLCARLGTATGTEQFILLDGSTYAQSKFPNLGASAFVTVSAPNFTVDKLTDTGRFIRSHIPGTTSPGQTQANQNLQHNHTASDSGHTHSINDQQHSHGASDSGHNHSFPGGNAMVKTVGGAENFGAGSAAFNEQTTTNNASAVISVSSSYTGINTTNQASASISVANEGGSEARPESYVAFMCIKT